MTEHMGREGGRALLPAEADRAAELPVPEPALVARQAGHGRSVGERDRQALRIAIDRTYPLDEVNGHTEAVDEFRRVIDKLNRILTN